MAKIVYFGDPDCTADAVQILDAIDKNEQNVDLYVNLGDNGYNGKYAKSIAMLEKYFPAGSEKRKKLVIILGNHDSNESEDDATEEAFGKFLPEQYTYPKEFDVKPDPLPEGWASWEKTKWLTSRQVGDIFFIGMNSQDMDIEFKGRNQFNWVMKQLAAAITLRQQGKIKWIINAVHKPWFTLKSSHSPYTAVREIYSEPFKKAGVNKNKHGHNHNDQGWHSMVAINQSGNAAGQQLQTFLADGKTIDHSKEHGWTTDVVGHSGHEHNLFKEDATANKNVMWANDKTFSYCVDESFPDGTLKTQWKDVASKVLFEYNISIAGGKNMSSPPPAPAAAANSAPTSPPPGEGYKWDPTLKKWVPILEHPSFIKNIPTQTLPPPPQNPTQTPPPPPPVVTGTIPVTPTAGGSLDENGVLMIYKTTGKKKPILVGGNPSGQGQRYNADFALKNYMSIGYFKTAVGQELIEMKTDGPCHGCGGNPAPIPIGMWYEPHLDLKTGKSSLHAEAPHSPRQDYDNLHCDLLVDVEGNINNEWIGYCVVAYTNAQNQRVIEQWVDRHPFDSAGKPVNKWVLTLRAVERGDGKMFPLKANGINVTFPRNIDDVFNYKYGRGGFEAEFRMHKAGSNEHGDPNGTDMKFANVYEIVPPQ